MRYRSTEHPISWLRDRHVEGNLELQKPMLQRRLVWKLRQKSNLVESILLGYPIPEVFIQQRTSPDGKSIFIVVDGQQRVSALLAFVGVKDDDPDNGFELKYLERESPFAKLSWDDFTDQQKADFYDKVLAVRMLSDTTDEQVRDIFRRFNKYTIKLSDQELRNATYSGPLIRLAEQLATDDYWTENKIVSAEDIRRMRDIEYVSELIIGLIHGPQGGSAKIIDEFYLAYEDYQDEIPNQAGVRRDFYRALDTVRALLPDIKATRWGNKTDFYTLFVAITHLLTSNRLPEENIMPLRASLDQFADKVAMRLASERRRVPEEVIRYVRAVEKGVSDKARRAERHQALLTVLTPYFVPRTA